MNFNETMELSISEFFASSQAKWQILLTAYLLDEGILV